jgi:hypothetical protein
MYIVQLLGGLGNQLFQFCFGQCLQAENSVPVFYDTRLLRNHAPGRHAVNRSYALDMFKVPVNLDPRAAIRYSADGYPRLIRGLLRLSGVTRPELQLTEKTFHFDPCFLRPKAPAYLTGLWQSIQYFSPIEKPLREMLRFRLPIDTQSVSLAEQISRPGSVSIHVRRTDYVTHQNSNSPLQFVGVNYYRNAIRLLQASTPGLRYFVFSDDLDWCRDELTFVPNPTFVTFEHAGYKDSGHLRLMSMADHIVIPNSTFSWWAAWLGDPSGKRVYMPNRWFRDPTVDVSGLYPADWQVVPVE